MKINKLFFAALAGPLFLASCTSNDTIAPLGSYDNGILVLNEGSSSTGSVTYISNDFGTVQQDVFDNVNGGSQSIGGFVQSIFFNGSRAFIISNGSNKITVVNRYTFEYLGTISNGLDVPRYGVVYNGKAYVTNLSSFASSTDDYIAVIDLATLNVEQPILVHDYAERIVEVNGKLIVANGSFGSGDSITIIDPVTNSVGEINIGGSPNSMEFKDNILYVLCSGFGTNSKLVRVDLTPDALIDVDEVAFPGAMDNAQNLDIDGDKAYFSVGPKVYRISLDADIVADAPLFDTGSTSFYIGYGFAVKEGKVYISEAADDFSSDGKVFVYSTSGTFIKQIPAGLGPNGFYFNE